MPDRTIGTGSGPNCWEVNEAVTVTCSGETPPDPKMKVTTARVSGGRACARGRERYAWAIVGSGGGFEGDLVAQCLEFADVVAGPAVEIDA